MGPCLHPEPTDRLPAANSRRQRGRRGGAAAAGRRCHTGAMDPSGGQRPASLTLGHLQRPHGRRRVGAALRRGRGVPGPRRRRARHAGVVDPRRRQAQHGRDGGRPARLPGGGRGRAGPRPPVRPFPTSSTRWGAAARARRKPFRLDDERWRSTRPGRPTGGPPPGAGASPSCPGSRSPATPGHPARAAPTGPGPPGGHRLHRRPGGRAALHLRHPHVPHHPRLPRPVPPPRRQLLPPADQAAVLAGDMNLWGPPVTSYFRGWRRAVTGRTWPAPGPTASSTTSWSPRRCRWSTPGSARSPGSDHRPVVVTLAPGLSGR